MVFTNEASYAVSTAYGTAEVAGVAVSLTPPAHARIKGQRLTLRHTTQVLVVAGAVSLVAVVPVLVVSLNLTLVAPAAQHCILGLALLISSSWQALRWYGPKLGKTRIMPFFVSLLVANVLQAIGTIVNAKWVNDRNVAAGHLCTAQGGIKQAGNVGMALWCVLRFIDSIMRRPTIPDTRSRCAQVLHVVTPCLYVAFQAACDPERAHVLGATRSWLVSGCVCCGYRSIGD